MSGTALPFAQIDAFADRPFGGNPAAVVALDDWLDDAVLQAIAAENNLSETAFLVRDVSGGADYALRWFTPSVEVALCGHATLASGHYLLGQGGPESGRDRVTFATRRSGVLSVERDGAGYRMALPAYPPEERALPGTLAALGIASAPTFHHPVGYSVTLLDDEAAVRDVRPDFARLAEQGDVLNIVTAPGAGHDVVSRVFAPLAGIDEDPVTGSAHSALTPFWAARLGRDAFSAFQASARGGVVGCMLDGDRAVLSGRCVTVIEGRFLL